jgi:hypothetical protein
VKAASVRHFPMGRKRLTVDRLLSAIEHLTETERQDFFAAMAHSNLAFQAGYVVVQRDLVENLAAMAKKAPKELEKAATTTLNLAIQLFNRNRKPDTTRLSRGLMILDIHGRGVVSWKNMPSHVIKHFPDWFPEYKSRVPTGLERKGFEERLRKMARDAKTREARRLPLDE